MPRITTIRVEPFDSVQGIGPDVTLPISRDYSADLAAAVEYDHYCDDSTCDIHWALEAGAPITAAMLLIGATECAHVDAVRCAHKFNGTAILSADPFAAPDWATWEAFHREHGRECASCGAFTYDDDAETCGNCLHGLA
jgi:hypothetical protein